MTFTYYILVDIIHIRYYSCGYYYNCRIMCSKCDEHCPAPSIAEYRWIMNVFNVFSVLLYAISRVFIVLPESVRAMRLSTIRVTALSSSASVDMEHK